ncbi:MAG: hypothetical protein JWL96_4601 [Sphingomonas bacterium]|uniref:lasso peptide biosynthesis B2 protein n=1 Tax=Sphingomonas bacterium TaxID=1895847 RepID=UPI00260FA9EB|nr:lasso peptide biosynthesis B2 protein [Sphingomonas bacterium]MDB5712531.1 hypothetical protein [Sphingomonas bacterium]
MFWRLLPHATICVASDRLILLDSRQDRYLMVPQKISGPVLAWLSAEPMTPAPKVLIDLLTAGGTLRAADARPGNAERFEITVPRTLAGGMCDASAADARHLPQIACIVIGTRLGLRFRGFDSTLRRLGASAIYGQCEPVAAALARIAAYERARRYVPLARNCLLDSLAQVRWLAKGGIGGRLVFGVTGEPFAAHCWLQSDKAILNDTYEHVSRFTPIMVL